MPFTWQPIADAPACLQANAAVLGKNLKLGGCIFQVMFLDTEEATWAVVRFSGPLPSYPIEFLPLPEPHG